ncbi:MAG: radical SAM protein [Spirochaetales bacterium]
MHLYTSCKLCNRICRVDRTTGERGFCRESDNLRIAWAGVHRGEEPILCGPGGSGTIFFTGCTLRCFFCQNLQLSRGEIGKEVRTEEFASLCLRLQETGVENINLVTGTHFIPSIVEGLALARKAGLILPVLWNSSGFENVLALSLLAPWVQIYVPDLKTLNPAFSKVVFNTPLYPETATQAILEMASQRFPRFEGDRLVEGVVVRHLVLPGFLENTREVIRWFSIHLRYRAILSLLVQYTPLPSMSLPPKLTDLFGVEWNRGITEEEYEKVLSYLEEFRITDGFVQELSPSENLLPDFAKPEAFPYNLASPIWSCCELLGANGGS